MTRLLTRFVFCLSLVLSGAAAQAALVLWTLDGVKFEDGTTATGSFYFDADTLTYSNVHITTTLATYDTTELAGDIGLLDEFNLYLIDNYVPGGANLEFDLNLVFEAALTNAGGVVPILADFPSYEGRCEFQCEFGTIIRRVDFNGRLVGTVVPEPAMPALLAVGLAGLALSRRSGAGLAKTRFRA